MATLIGWYALLGVETTVQEDGLAGFCSRDVTTCGRSVCNAKPHQDGSPRPIAVGEGKITIKKYKKGSQLIMTLFFNNFALAVVLRLN